MDPIEIRDGKEVPRDANGKRAGEVGSDSRS